MNARLVAAAVVVLTTCCAAACAAPSAEVVARVTIPGPAHWNYLHVDSQGHRLYLAHGSQIEVIDTHSNQLVGTVADTPGVRAIDIAADLGLGYASNGKDDSVTVFDLATLAHKATIAAGSSPDAIVYDRTHQRVLVFNTRSHDITVIDAKAGRVLATVAAGGEPETAVLGADGLVYFNVEDTHELVVFDPDAMVVVRRHSLRPCERPTGLAIDSEGSFYSVCRNGVMVVSGADGRPVGVATIGRGRAECGRAQRFRWIRDGGPSAHRLRIAHLGGRPGQPPALPSDREFQTCRRRHAPPADSRDLVDLGA
jgi:YVTN family beta-propeller protein